MTARMNYLGYFTDDESIAVHEAGHAVAALRAGWPFSHIELTDPDDNDDEKWRQQEGAFVWHPDRDVLWEMRQPLYAGMFAGDESVRRSLVIHSLAGAVAERLLCEWYVVKPYPSVPDVNILAKVGHYPPETRYHLMQWFDYRYRDNSLEAKLEAIFAPDMPMVEAFVIENQRAIGDVAHELWHRTWQRMDGESWRDLPYDKIRKLAGS